MTGPGYPPPEGVPQGGDDEYRSTVFDEAFVRAARLQELSAQERMRDRDHPVRALPPAFLRGAVRQGVLLALLIVLVLGTTVYMGVRGQPRLPADPLHQQPLRSTVVPLAPSGRVPGGNPQELLEHSPAARFETGAAGVSLPPVRGTEHFSDEQVLAALAMAKEYVAASSINPEVLTGATVRPVRAMLDPLQHRQFDRSLERPAADGRHAATAWLVRFAPGTALVGEGVRVAGTMEVQEAAPGTLEVTADHVFVYAVRSVPAVGGGGGGDRGGGTARNGGAEDASLFTVHREVQLRIDREDLRRNHVTVHRVFVQAGPASCASEPFDALRPVPAGRSVDRGERPAGTDPYAAATGEVRVALCGTLDPGSLPRP